MSNPALADSYSNNNNGNTGEAGLRAGMGFCPPGCIPVGAVKKERNIEHWCSSNCSSADEPAFVPGGSHATRVWSCMDARERLPDYARGPGEQHAALARVIDRDPTPAAADRCCCLLLVIRRDYPWPIEIICSFCFKY